MSEGTDASAGGTEPTSDDFSRASGAASGHSRSGGGVVLHQDVKFAPEWWAVEPLKQVGYGADSDWVKGMLQREMGVMMACRLHDLTTAGRLLVYAAVGY
jgi:hypothetical protein